MEQCHERLGLRGRQFSRRFGSRILQRPFQKPVWLAGTTCDLRHLIVDSIRRLFQQPGGNLIVSLLPTANAFRQFEAGQLETVFQERNPHDKKRAQLRLHLADVAPQFEVPAAGGAELEKYAIGKQPLLYPDSH